MFLDEYKLHRSDNGVWVRVNMTEEDIVLPSDQKLYEGLVVESATDGVDFTIEGDDSWLRSGSFFEHYKVWCRTPASPHVRNLWARIPNGLAAGSYRVTILVNSPVWTEEWGVESKRVVLSASHFLGSAGAVKTLGFCCLFFGIAEILGLLLIVAAPTMGKLVNMS